MGDSDVDNANDTDVTNGSGKNAKMRCMVAPFEAARAAGTSAGVRARP